MRFQNGWPAGVRSCGEIEYAVVSRVLLAPISCSLFESDSEASSAGSALRGGNAADGNRGVGGIQLFLRDLESVFDDDHLALSKGKVPVRFFNIGDEALGETAQLKLRDFRLELRASEGGKIDVQPGAAKQGLSDADAGIEIRSAVGYKSGVARNGSPDRGARGEELGDRSGGIEAVRRHGGARVGTGAGVGDRASAGDLTAELGVKNGAIDFFLGALDGRVKTVDDEGEDVVLQPDENKRFCTSSCSGTTT